MVGLILAYILLSLANPAMEFVTKLAIIICLFIVIRTVKK
jgi:hypothetical protein